ncbi:hypothetical protein GCM10010096_27950 [Alcaligenes pakistanensis]|uniref:Uncharacterized protein n=1 Tax=Alcaligenes pakistanensis TaxID=1482717 RepID=A0A8H9IRN4_9BURK|nr:hypothetical protein GCM10010096_27950 [Alcaligenes pakistanensis]
MRGPVNIQLRSTKDAPTRAAAMGKIHIQEKRDRWEGTSLGCAGSVRASG